MDAASLILIAVGSFVVAVGGGVAGLVLGNLRLPLVVLVASSPAAAAGANVAISGIAAATAAGAHLRGGRIDRRLLWLMAPPSLIGGAIGGRLAGVLPDRLLLALIALVVFYGAFEVSRHRPRPVADGAGPRSRTAPAILIGLVIGVLGGIVGLILGALRLPAMLRWVGADRAAAVGTNSAIGLALAVGAVVGHLGSDVEWELVAVGGAASIPGALIGARMVGRLDERALLRAIAVVLAVAGLGMLAAALAG